MGLWAPMLWTLITPHSEQEDSDPWLSRLQPVARSAGGLTVCVSAVRPFQDVGWDPRPAWREAEGGSWRQGRWPKKA